MGTVMYLGVRLFIAAIFFIVGLSFLVTTGVLAWEFNQLDWLGLAAFYSHLFVFYPTFGIVALVAFYLPACVFLDMYWRYVPFGRLRFIVGFLAVVALSAWIGTMLRSGVERSVFEIAPATLSADKGAGCAPNGTCKRVSALTAIDNVRQVSQERIGLSDLARNCEIDLLKEDPTERLKVQRYCFATNPYSKKASRISDGDCCIAQKEMLKAVNSMYENPLQRSTTGVLHGYLIGFNVFFLLMMLVISLMLAFRRKQLERHYPGYLHGIERGVLVGAVALVVYPIMVQAFLQSANLIYGSETPGGFRSIAPYITFGFGAFALLLLFFFYRRRDKEMQSVARIGGVVGSGIAIIKYDQIIDIFVRLFGSGAGLTNLLGLLALAAAALVVLFMKTTHEISRAPIDEEMLTEVALEAVDQTMPR